MIHKRTYLWIFSLLIGAAVAPTVASAQVSNVIEFQINRFQPTAASLNPYRCIGRICADDIPQTATNYYVTEGAATLPHLTPSAQLLLGYVHRPLRLRGVGTNPERRDIIDYRLGLDFTTAIGFWDRLELGIALPVVLTQNGDSIGILRGEPSFSLESAVGDLRIIPKAHFLTQDWFSIGAAMPILVPTGSAEDFTGATGVELAPRLVLGFDWSRIGFAVNAGYRWRSNPQHVAVSSSVSQQQITIDDEFFWSAGGRVGLIEEHLDLVGDTYFSISVKEQNIEEVWGEALTGLRYYFPFGLTLNLAAGPGFTKGVGTPAFRVIAGASWTAMPERKPEPKPAPPAPKKPADTDKDGIVDPLDKCPLQPEDHDGYQDSDGCPDLDNDGDGIVDKRDRCPMDPEDHDGFEDEDGCPDKDNDNDGILDPKDACPNHPETVNGIEDEDGCPDQAGPMPIRHGKIEVPRIHFKTNRAKISERSHTVLFNTARTLQENGWIKRIRIEGHCDDRGDAQYNLELSRKRALSVVAFLRSMGIAEERMEYDGFGESRPIASNKTKEGRAKNRRVDFVIVDPPLGQ